MREKEGLVCCEQRIFHEGNQVRDPSGDRAILNVVLSAIEREGIVEFTWELRGHENSSK
jgi:signal transduction histidine kinase